MAGKSSRIESRTPMLLAKTSQKRLCHAAQATGCGALPDEIEASGGYWLMNPPVVHLQQAVAARGQTAIMSRHDQRYALGGDNLQQQIEYRARSEERRVGKALRS